MKIFRESFEAKEKCNLGCEHHVMYSEVIEVEEVASELRQQWYGDVDCGKMLVRWYADAEGTIYFQGADWSGPSHYLSTETEEVGIARRPWGHEVRKDIEGNLLDYSGEVIDGIGTN